MDSMSAFFRGQAAQGNPIKVFDWKKAAEIIRDEKPGHAQAGLIEDWEYTGDTIYEDGEIRDDGYTFLSSNWATPTIIVDGDERDCFVMESETDWHSGTVLPNEAREILGLPAIEEEGQARK